MQRSVYLVASLLGLSLLAGTAQALQTDSVAPEKLKAYGATLSQSAGNSQWQQMWQRTRNAGFLDLKSRTHFTVDKPRLPDMTASALGSAHGVTPQRVTQAVYRYDFGSAIGVVDAATVTALCVEVDWRSLPSDSPVGDTAYMGGVSLLLSRPCP